MLFYFSIFIFLLFFSFYEISSSKKKLSICCLFILFFLILSFIRWETGTDWKNYYSIFKSIKEPWGYNDDPYTNQFEIGFIFLNNLARTFSNSYTIMLLLEGLIIYSCLYISISKNSIYPIFSLLIYYTMSLAGIFFVRQTIAMSILLYSLTYIKNRNFLFFFLIVIIATLIHRTAIIFLITYPLFYRHFKLRQIFLIICLTLFLGLFFNRFIINILSNLNLGIISAKINVYLSLGSDESYTTYSSTTVLLRGLLNRLFLIGIYLIILNKIRKNNPFLNGLINLNLLGVILYVLLTPISFSLGRVSVYFDIIQIFILPYLIKYSNKPTRKLLLIFLTLYLGLRLYTIVSSYPEAYIPYKTIF